MLGDWKSTIQTGKNTQSFDTGLKESSCLYSIVLLRLRELDVEVVVVTLLVHARERVSYGRRSDPLAGLKHDGHSTTQVRECKLKLSKAYKAAEPPLWPPGVTPL